MPELPEVEVTRRGIVARLEGQRLERAVLRAPTLRYPLPAGLARKLAGRTLVAAKRRGKYLLLDFEGGHLMIHLGMSGSLRFVADGTRPARHDHADFVFGETVLRFTDPRRFGAILWLVGDPLQHPLLAKLGIEPLARGFTPAWLHDALRGKKQPIKQAIMDGGLVVGVGNIYASESLFDAGIDPRTPANELIPTHHSVLVPSIRKILRDAIRAGGSTLRDFCGPDGMGDFQVKHQVYGRAGQPCLRCGTPIEGLRQGQRSTFYCPVCQS